MVRYITVHHRDAPKLNIKGRIIEPDSDKDHLRSSADDRCMRCPGGTLARYRESLYSVYSLHNNFRVMRKYYSNNMKAA